MWEDSVSGSMGPFWKKNIFESPTRLDQDERMQVWEYVCTHNRSHAGRHWPVRLNLLWTVIPWCTCFLFFIFIFLIFLAAWVIPSWHQLRNCVWLRGFFRWIISSLLSRVLAKTTYRGAVPCLEFGRPLSKLKVPWLEVPVPSIFLTAHQSFTRWTSRFED